MSIKSARATDNNVTSGNPAARLLVVKIKKKSKRENRARARVCVDFNDNNLYYVLVYHGPLPYGTIRAAAL